jgi:2-iminobutanoate/2-iminopropanoate deaminase
MKRYNPPELPIPAAFSHAVAVPSNACTVYVAGQVGRRADGTIPKGIDAQTRVVFENLGCVLHSAGLTLEDLVKTTVFLTDRADQATFLRVRSEILGSNRPASTLIYVSGLASPGFCVEIEAVAARATVRLGRDRTSECDS